MSVYGNNNASSEKLPEPPELRHNLKIAGLTEEAG